MQNYLQTKLVELRPISEADTENIVRWRNNPRVLCQFLDRQPLTAKIHKNWLSTNVYTKKAYQFIIHYRPEEMDIGTIFLRGVDTVNNHAEFGIFIGQDGYEGKGLGQLATKQILQYGFYTLGLHKIFLRVLANNTIAQTVYKKAGFTIEGVFKEHIYNGAEYHDLVFMATLKKD